MYGMMTRTVSRLSSALFKFQPFSKKQLKILSWWMPGSPAAGYDGIIADGAIRSGKTVSMGLSFVLWAMHTFNGENFAMCGKTIQSLRRNVIKDLKKMLAGRGYKVIDKKAENMLIITFGDVVNEFYLFGGKDKASQDLIQGITLAGVFFDEVALMPESFVNQATGRCSVDGSKFWFNCNPESPNHWFKIRWIDAAGEKNLLYLHFTMDDNLSLTEKVKARYRAMYTGVFYERYIRGLWKVAEGLIYTTFTDENIYDDETRPLGLERITTREIACDYGTTNPCVFLDTYDDGETLWIDREYRWDSRSVEAQRTGKPQKTDSQYADDMAEFMGNDPEFMCGILVDPSAASFIAELKGRGFYVKQGDNDVLDGIRVTSSMMEKKKIMVHRRCLGLIDELRSYVWDEKAAMRGEDKPVKEKDHGPDALRYKVNSLPTWRRMAYGLGGNNE